MSRSGYTDDNDDPLAHGRWRPVIECTQASRERPILFSVPMVRALLDGTKTQTRRLMNTDGRYRLDLVCPPDGGMSRCPSGQPGDRLWVRETFAHIYRDNARPDERRDGDVVYKADCQGLYAYAYGTWKPSIHMPRWASRITLVVTGVRVERLQDINRGDAMDEGCPFHNMAQGDDPRQWYAELWEQINGAGSWAANPWVWVVEFRKTPNA